MMQTEQQAPEKLKEQGAGMLAGLGGVWVILIALLFGGSFYTFLLFMLFLILPAFVSKPKNKRRRKR